MEDVTRAVSVPLYLATVIRSATTVVIRFEGAIFSKLRRKALATFPDFDFAADTVIGRVDVQIHFGQNTERERSRGQGGVFGKRTHLGNIKKFLRMLLVSLRRVAN